MLALRQKLPVVHRAPAQTPELARIHRVMTPWLTCFLYMSIPMCDPSERITEYRIMCSTSSQGNLGLRAMMAALYCAHCIFISGVLFCLFASASADQSPGQSCSVITAVNTSERRSICM